MSSLGALSQSWVSAEASLPLGWRMVGLLRRERALRMLPVTEHARRGDGVDRSAVWHGRLYCQFFWVEGLLSRVNGRWPASVDTPDGPSLGWGCTAVSAMILALEPFEGMTMELLHSAPHDLNRLLE